MFMVLGFGGKIKAKLASPSREKKKEGNSVAKKHEKDEREQLWHWTT